MGHDSLTRSSSPLTQAGTARPNPSAAGAGSARSGRGGFADALRSAATSMAEADQASARVLDRARHSQAMSQEQLITLQATVYRYEQQLELTSKLVDKSASAVRQTLTSQS